MPKLLKIFIFFLPVIFFISAFFLNSGQSFAYTTSDLYFKKAYNFYKSGNYKRAEGLFWLYMLKGRLLAGYALYYQGLGFIKSKDYRKADFVLSKLVRNYRNFVFYNNAVFYLAVSEKRNGYSYSSIRHFRYIIRHAATRLSRANAIFQTAKIYLSLKDYAKARSYLLLLYIRYPDFSQKHDITVILKHIPHFNGIYMSKHQKIERASALYHSFHYTKTLHLLSGIKGREAAFIRIKALLKTKNPLFLKDIGKLLKRSGRSRVELLYLQSSYYYYDLHKPIRALNRLKFILKENGSLSKQGMFLYKSIVWHSVLNDLKNGEIINARESLKSLLNIMGNYGNNAKYLFWYGVVLKKIGLTKDALFYFNIVKSASVFSYYGMMSRIETETPVNFNNHKNLDIKNSLSLFNKTLRRNYRLNILFKRFEVLSNLKIYFLANIEAQNITEKVKTAIKNRSKRFKYAVLISMIYIMNRYGNYGYASGAAAILLHNNDGRALSRNVNFLRLAYPKPYSFYVNRYATRYDIPVNLVYAVMRQESFYNPSSFSSANAIGLMQIIPSTGYYIADKVGHYGFNASMLYSKKINIKFGSYYLKTLLDRFDNKKYLAIASYNAGPDAVDYWKGSLFKRDNMLLFIEFIPFAQTRNYVKKVLRNYYLYNAIY